MPIQDGDPHGATTLEPDELAGLKHAHITTRGELDELEQANVQQGLLWLDRVRNPDVVDDAFLRKLHDKLFGDVWEWAGVYRLREKNIGIDPRLIGVQVRQLLGDARYWKEHNTYAGTAAHWVHKGKLD